MRNKPITKQTASEELAWEGVRKYLGPRWVKLGKKLRKQEFHHTQKGWCCACEYDQAVISHQLLLERERVIKDIEEWGGNMAIWSGVGREVLLVIKLSDLFEFLSKYKPKDK